MKTEEGDSLQDVMVNLSQGNPGALTAMVGIVKNHQDLGPLAMFGGRGPLMALDMMGIYGSEIYILWNDICKRNLRRFCALIAADFSYVLPRKDIKKMARTGEDTLTENQWKELETEVCERIGNFNKEFFNDKK